MHGIAEPFDIPHSGRAIEPELFAKDGQIFGSCVILQNGRGKIAWKDFRARENEHGSRKQGQKSKRQSLTDQLEQ
jgi:hypothetical protein